MHLTCCEIKSNLPIFKTEMLIYESKVNLNEKILFRRITCDLDPKIRKMLARGVFRNKYSRFHSGP